MMRSDLVVYSLLCGVTQDSRLYSDKIRGFKQADAAEAAGAVSCFASVAADILQDMYTRKTGPAAMPTTEERESFLYRIYEKCVTTLQHETSDQPSEIGGPEWRETRRGSKVSASFGK